MSLPRKKNSRPKSSSPGLRVGDFQRLKNREANAWARGRSKFSPGKIHVLRFVPAFPSVFPTVFPRFRNVRYARGQEVSSSGRFCQLSRCVIQCRVGCRNPTQFFHIKQSKLSYGLRLRLAGCGRRASGGWMEQVGIPGFEAHFGARLRGRRGRRLVCRRREEVREGHKLTLNQTG